MEKLEPRMLLSAGLTAQYFSSDTGAGLTGFLKTQVDTAVNFGGNGSAWDSGVPANFSARWEGYIDPTVTGTYSFYTDVNGGVHLWVAPIPIGSASGTQEVINDWSAHTTEDTSGNNTVNLTAGTKYAIKMEYISYSGNAAAELQWSATSGNATVVTKAPIPAADLSALDSTQSTYTPTAPNTTVPTSYALTGAPAGWSYADIDSPSPAGNSSYANGTFTINGGGQIVTYGPTGLVNDQCQYAYEQATGDFTFTTEITSMTTSGVDYAGIMLRNGMTASVPMDLVACSSTLNCVQLIRVNAGAASVYSSYNEVTQAFPFWLELVRYGNQVVTYYAPNNSGAPGTWIEQCGQSFSYLPQTLDIGLAASARYSSTDCTATFADVSLAPLARSWITSYLGNSYGGGQEHVISNVNAAYVNPATGQSVLVGGDEDDSLSIYNSDGTFVAFGDQSHYQGGDAVAEDSNFIYYGQTKNYAYQFQGVQTYDHYGIIQRSDIMGTDTVNGLAVIGGVLYVATDNMVYGINTSTLAFNGTMFEVDNAASMVVDAAGTGLWIVQNAGSGGTPAADIVQYTISGNTATVTGNISFGNLGNGTWPIIPRGIAVSPINGNVYVTDIGILQDVHIYSGNGTYVGDYGYQYGIYGTGGNTTAGSAAPLKFIFPVAVGIDDSGNVYVFNRAPLAPAGTSYSTWDSGTIIQKYSTGNILLWQRDGLEYVDTADPDPASPTNLYSDCYHYQINYNDLTAGTETVLVGTMVDPFATIAANGFNGAVDPRLIPSTVLATLIGGVSGESPRAGSQVREIAGNKYLFDFDQHASAVNIYRFLPGTQFTVFCAELQHQIDRYHSSDDGFYIWTDVNGDGVKQAGEESIAQGDEEGGGGRESFNWNIDANGNIWTADSGAGIREYLVQGINGIGAPIYLDDGNTTHLRKWSAPSPFTELCRAIYDSSTDSLYLSGYTTTYPRAGNDTTGGSAGPELFKYSNWLAGNGTGNYTWAVALPYTPDTSDMQVGHLIASLQVAGGANGYFFAAWAMNNAEGVQVYSAATGTLVTDLASGPEIGGGSTNGPDLRNCLTVTQLSDGEYILFNEEVEEAKVTMFRWSGNEMPGLWGDQNIGNATGNSTWTAIGNWSQASTGGNIGGSSDVFNLASQLFTGDGQIIAQVNSMATGANAAAQAGVMFRDGTAANADNVALVLTKANGIEFQDRAIAGGNTTLAATVSGITAPVWLDLVRNGNTFYAYYSTSSSTPTSWTAIGNVTVNMAATVQAGTAVSANSASMQNLAVFSNVQLQQSLTDYNIGNATPAGSSGFNSDSYTWTVSGGGGNIAGTSDQFHLTSESFSGNGMLTARVAYQSGAQSTAQSGVMFRNDTSAGAAYAAVLATPGNGVAFQWRSSNGGNTSSTIIAGMQDPVWVRLIRVGNTFSGYYSLDGFNWNQIGSTQTLTIAATVQAGMAVSASGGGSLNTANITNFAITASATPAFGNLSTPSSITYGSPSATFGGSIAAGTLNPPSTETVAITLNGVTQNAAINSQGNFTGTFTTSALSAAVYQVTYAYAGDMNFNSVTDNTTTTLTVNKSATATIVTSSNSAPNYDQTVTFTATVTPAGGSGETGTVQFQIDGGNVGSQVLLSGNTASYATATLRAGNHTIVAIYGGDGNFTSSTSPAFIQGITPVWFIPSTAATWNAGNQSLTLSGNTTLIADPNTFGVEPIIYGNTGNLTVDTTVADGGDGDALVHIAALSGNGATTVNATSLLVAGNFSQASLINNGTVILDGNSTIGQLSGNGSLTIGNGSSHNSVQLTALAIPDTVANTQHSLVISAGSTLDITNNTLLLDYGNGSSPLAAVLAGVANGSISSSTASAGQAGEYTVGYADATELGSVPAGNVKLLYTLAGDALLNATVNFDDYSVLQNNYNQSGRDWAQGDFNHDGLVNFNDYSLLQNNYNQWVKAMPALTWATPAAIAYGTALSAAQLDATASVPGTFAYSPAAGTVLPVGTQLLSVTFAPTDTTDYATVTDSINLTVNKTATTTAVTANGSTIHGQAVTFTATVTPAGGSGETGNVQFQIDGGNVGAPVALSSNMASYTTASLALGNHTVAAIYRGDGNFAGSTSPTFTQVVGQATLTYTLSINDDGTGNYCAGHYAVYAADTLNNAGLASYEIRLGGTATLSNYSPKGNYDDGSGCGTEDALGFTALRTANNVSPVTASQDTVDYAVGGKVILVYGCGQSAGNLAGNTAPGSTGAIGATTQAVYGTPLDLIKGTFTGAAPTFTTPSSDTGNIFLTSSGYGTQAAILVFSTVTVVNNNVSQPALLPAVAATNPAANTAEIPVYRLYTPATAGLFDIGDLPDLEALYPTVRTRQ